MVLPSDTNWKGIPLAGSIMEPGCSEEYVTGTWRTYRPIHDAEKCIDCMTCWILCPDSAILVEDGKVVGMDYQHCKGCGICAVACPDKVKAITMILESDAHKE